MKLVNNVVAAGVRAITFEALAMGVKNGLSLETCAEVLHKGSARRLHGPRSPCPASSTAASPIIS